MLTLLLLPPLALRPPPPPRMLRMATRRPPPFMLARRGKRTAPASPRVMQRSATGVPEIAACHPERYSSLLRGKVAHMEALLAASLAAHPGAALPPAQVFESARLHFRMRASFKFWREGEGLHYVMFNREDARTPQEVVHYPMGSVRMNDLMGALREELLAAPSLAQRVNDARFLTTTTGEALVTLTYNRPIAAPCSRGLMWEAEAAAVAERLGVSIIGRSRNVAIATGAQTVRERLHVEGRGVCEYEQMEGAFTQPNAGVCQSMLAWAYDATRGLDATDLCELYCGNGCFTIALAPNFRRVVATEVSKTSVLLAETNLRHNNISNVRIARLSAEEFAMAYYGKRPFRRLEEAGIFVEDFTRRSTPSSSTLRAPGWTPRAFPYTPHLECGVLLERRSLSMLRGIQNASHALGGVGQ
ncbi:hypothetical protein AB1Y20_011774 [Prymnesium parvum]|uniref:tRNA(Phe) (4-demethylwyosine(37)-C(7)) aminocarboxypropyltransferase n=1 Tax=Prymnesium parvum TaxID=97485 RepID=A0AB34IKX7_PRYPA